MGTFPIDQLAGLLNSLGERARSAPNPDLRAAVGLVSDIGRVAISGGEGDIRATQSAVGALMQRIGEGEQVERTPSKNLQSADSQTYLAGAMWALSEVLDRRLELIDAQRADSSQNTRREQVSKLVSDALIRGESVSPSELLSSTLDDGTNVRRDELSRAFGAFIDKGWVHVVSGDQGRKKFFALTPAGRDILGGVFAGFAFPWREFGVSAAARYEHGAAEGGASASAH